MHGHDRHNTTLLSIIHNMAETCNNNNNNNNYILKLGCYPVAVVILHVNKHEIGYY